MNSRTFIVPLLVSLIVVVIVVSVYYAITGVMPGSATYIEEPSVISDVNQEEARFMFFYTQWCGWSKEAKTTWDSFKQMMRNNPRKFGGKIIVFEEIDAESDKGKAALYKIEEYPTFKLKTADKVFTMISKPTVTSFRNFLISALGKETPYLA